MQKAGSDKNKSTNILVRNDFAGNRLVFFNGKTQSNSFFEVLEENNEIDTISIYDFILFGAILPPHSPLKDVELLFPGEKIYTNGERVNEYTDLCHGRTISSIEEIVDVLESKLDEYFSRYNFKKSAILLSGGIDSAILASYLPADVLPITWGGWGEQSTDVKYSRLNVEAFGLSNHKCLFREYSRDIDLYKKTVKKLGIPLLFSSAIPFIRMAEFASRDGIEKWVMGQNADTIFLSYAPPQKVKLTHYLQTRIPSFVFKFLSDTRKKSLFSKHRSLMEIFAYFKSSGLYPGPWLNIPDDYFKSKNKLLEEKFYLSTYSLDKRLILMEELQTEARRNQISQGDIAEMYGIQSFRPYYEKEIVELVFNLDKRIRKKGKYGKEPLKRLALRRGVPEEVIYKGKKGLSYDTNGWLEQDFYHDYWDQMEKDGFLNSFIDVRLLRQKKEKDGFIFDVLFSLYVWGEVIAKPKNLI